MFSMPKVLVCTDFTESSDTALMVASEFVNKFKGELHVMHAAEVDFYISWRAFGVPPMSENQLSELMHLELMERLKGQLIKCSVKGRPLVVFSSSKREAILETVKELEVDLVVMGEKKHLSGLTRKIAGQLTTPLLVVKRKSMNVIAGLIDPFEMSDKILNCSEELALQLGGKLCLISLFPQYLALLQSLSLEYSSSFLNLLKKISEEKSTELKTKLEKSLVRKDACLIVQPSGEKDLGLHLTEILQENCIDLAILQNHHKSWSEKHLLGSVSERVLDNFEGNLLVL